jgi:hypothetical protein
MCYWLAKPSTSTHLSSSLKLIVDSVVVAVILYLKSKILVMVSGGDIECF